MTSPILRFQQAITSKEWLFAVTLGLVAGVEAAVKFGHCPNALAVDTDVWERGATQRIYVFPPDAGEAMELVAEEVLDVGISVVTEGLGEEGLFKREVKDLNGTTPVALGGLWSAIHRVYNDEPEGPGSLFTGDVLVQGAGGGAIYAVADDDDQQTSQAVFKVPSNRVAMVIGLSNAMNSGTGGPDSGVINRLRIANTGKNFRSREYFGLQETGTSNIPTGAPLPLVVGPLTRIKAQATPSVDPMDISAKFSLLLMDVAFFDAPFLANLQQT